MSEEEQESWSYSYCNPCADGCQGCLCGFMCTKCYMARARTRYDHSNWWLNMNCMGQGVIRAIVREGYGLKAAKLECLKSLIPCLNAIQVNAEVSKRGSRVMSQDKEEKEWSNNICSCCADGSKGCLCATFCLPCYMALARTKFDHSKCYMNLFCLGSVAIRNIIREGYGIKGNCITDLMYTYMCPCCMAIQTMAEVKERGDLQSQSNYEHGGKSTDIASKMQTQITNNMGTEMAKKVNDLDEQTKQQYSDQQVQDAITNKELPGTTEEGGDKE